MTEPTPLTSLVQRHRQGDPDAAAELFAYYARRLSRLAEQFISRKLAGRIEGDDVVQSVFRTFFRRCTAGEFQIDSSAQLWQLLVKITMLKARAQGRRHTAAQRDARRASRRRRRLAGGREPGPIRKHGRGWQPDQANVPPVRFRTGGALTQSAGRFSVERL